MNNYEEIVGSKTRFENCTENELRSYFYSFENKWVHRNNKDVSIVLQKALDNFGLSENFTYEQLNTNYKKCLYNVIYLNTELSNCLSEERSDELEELKTKFYKIIESIDYSCKILKFGCVLMNSHSDENIDIKDDLGELRFITPNIETNSPFQNLILYLLDSIYLDGLQRYGTFLYEKVFYNNHFTHAWHEKISIKDYIYSKTEYCQDYQQWHNFTSNASSIKHCSEFLENCHDHRLHDLKKDRHVFAFTNGIYNCKEETVIDGVTHYIDHFYEYGSDITKALDSMVVACKFFKMEFDNYDSVDDWYNIPTPFLQSIFDYQEFDEDVSRWLYVFIGRLMFNLGELDNWQVALFLEGVAGSGKSTITKIVKKFYETCDVGVLSNNIEKTFGLGSLKDKLLFLAPEIKSDLRLEQSEFQLLIEGGDMQLPIKHKESHYIEWKIPGLFAGNEPPDYTDNSGSISRRLVVAKFNKKVMNKDSDMDRKLTEELPSIMKKAACAYLSAVNNFKGKDFWSSLPKYFRDTQQDMAQNTHALEHFISSGKVIFGENLYVREKIFVQAFNEHCRECNLDRHKFTTDYYLGVFGNYNISLKKNLKLKYPNAPSGKTYTGSFIYGLDLVNDDEEADEF
jgi:hypothetical protein